MSAPRMGISPTNGNNNRRSIHLNRVPLSGEKTVCSQHDDLIKYIFDSWNKVSQEADRSNGASVIFYQDPEITLRDFQPFDLEGFWGRKLVQNFQQTTFIAV